jgi:hypothetical protein
MRGYQRTLNKAETYSRWNNCTKLTPTLLSLPTVQVSSDSIDPFAGLHDWFIPSQLVAPLTNTVVSLIQFGMWDLGAGSVVNLIENFGDRSKYLQRCPNCPYMNKMLDSVFDESDWPSRVVTGTPRYGGVLESASVDPASVDSASMNSASTRQLVSFLCKKNSSRLATCFNRLSRRSLWSICELPLLT